MAAALALSISVGSTACFRPATLSRTSLCSACATASAPLPFVFPLRIRASRSPGRSSLSRTLTRCEQRSSRMSNSNNRGSAAAAAAQGSTAAPEAQGSGQLTKNTATPLSMTYLEGNSWLWEVLGLKILVDPVLVGNLDFGIPWLYDGAKIKYKDFKLEDLPKIDYLLITQGYDDHCHDKTLGPLSRLQPNLHVISTPNGEKILSKYFKKVSYLEPKTKESITLKATSGADVIIRASPGPILGPPWQRPESGYFVEATEPKFIIYHEPHCIFANANLEDERADVFVTPVIKQRLPGYTLVSGQEDAVKVAEWLKPKFIVTMQNAELDAKGALSKAVSTVGTVDSFKELIAKKLPNTEVFRPVPAVPLEIPV